MKKIIKLILIVLFFTSQASFAETLKILVLPDNLYLNNKNYLVYPEFSEFVSRDIINHFRQHNIVTPQLTTVKDLLERDFELKHLTQDALRHYQLNYNVDFNTMTLLSEKFKTRHILLVTTNLDTQNYFLRRTVWDFLNIPGATVIDPAYRVSTFATLVDTQTQRVLWQDNYQKLISSRENRIIADSFGPSAEQLDKLYTYSSRFLAPAIGQEAQIHASDTNYFLLRPELVRAEWWTWDKGKTMGKSAINLTARGVYLGSDYALDRSIEGGKYVGRKSIEAHKNLKLKHQELKLKRQIEKKQKAELKAVIKREKARLEVEKQKQLQQEISNTSVKKNEEVIKKETLKPQLRNQSTINDL